MNYKKILFVLLLAMLSNSCDEKIKNNAIDSLDQYVEEYLKEYKPLAFQFRMNSINSKSYKLLKKVSKSPSLVFVAATWAHHSIGHDDNASLENPSNGWGWLISRGVTIIETDRPKKLLSYLREEKLHK